MSYTLRVPAIEGTVSELPLNGYEYEPFESASGAAQDIADRHNRPVEILADGVVVAVVEPWAWDDEEEPPVIDDGVKCCPDCEKPNQFGQLCDGCERERQRELEARS